MVQLSLETLVNQNLFSRHYLEERLPESDEWKETEEEARKAFQELKRIWEREKGTLPNRTNHEEGVRSKWITPILEDVLGFAQEKEQTTDSATAPDYALFSSEEERSDAVSRQDEEDLYSNALTVLEAKAWNTKLDKKKRGGGQKFEKENPTFQLHQYLLQTDTRWGILTDGKDWRLFNRKESSKLDTYFRVDLAKIVEEDDFEAFRYFYFIFRKKAFTGQPGETELDRILEQSHRYSREVGEDLEDNVYQALEWLAQGYFDVKGNDLDPEEDRQLVHDKSLLLLYRLLFLFYTDSRGILPDPAEKGHPRYSFPNLVKEILDDRDNDAVDDLGVSYRNHLVEIFKMVDKGSESHGIPKEEMFVPPYNGDLFQMTKEDEDGNEQGVFFKKYTLRDKYLAKAVDLLARRGNKQVDYADLSIRHLGGIYEGLLEYKLVHAPERRVVEDGEWVAVDEADASFDDKAEDMRVEEGEVYLETDQGERKVTGSYYTPDYVVQYIVENTLDPKIDAIIEDADDDEEIRNRILDLDVLDPAMGSGHFLVGAVDHIASRLLPYTEQDIQNVKRDVARRCIYGVDINPLATELAKVSIWLNTVSSDKPLSFLDHHLKTGNSLVGADVFDLDTHPAEESDTEEQNASQGQTTLADKFGGEDDGQVISDNIKQLLQMYRRIMDMPENQPDDIHEQEEIYHEFRQHKFRRRFDALADVYTSYWFGNEYSTEQYRDLLDAFQPGSGRWEEVVQQDWVRRATDAVDDAELGNLSDGKQFFHWKLEFPEVFFDIENGTEQENPGFDAVMGNPPYIRIQRVGHQQADYLFEHYETCAKKVDLSLPFLEKGVTLSSEEGYAGFISTYQWLQTDYGESARKYMGRGYIQRMVDFGTLPVFEGVSTYPAIFLLTSRPVDNMEYAQVAGEEGLNFASLDTLDFRTIDYERLDNREWVLDSLDLRKVLKEDSDTAPLNSEWGEFHIGALTGMDEVFVVSKEEIENHNLEEDILIPYAFRGEEVHRYSPVNPSKHVIYPYKRGEDGSAKLMEEDELEQRYPNTYEYLKSRKDDLEEREDSRRKYAKGDGWYQFLRQGRYDYIEPPKLIIRGVSTQATVGYLEEDTLFSGANTPGFILQHEHYDPYFFLALFNSSLISQYLIQVCPAKMGGYTRFNANNLNQIPVPRISFDGNEDAEGLIEQVLNCIGETSDTAVLLSDIEDAADSTTHDVLSALAEEMANLVGKRHSLNLNVLDYLRVSDGETTGEKLGSLSVPPSGVADTILTDTKEDRDNLRVGSVEFRESGGTLTLLVSARYKPEDEDAYETDQYGYTETDPIPAMEFHDLSEMQAALVKEFVPVAVDEAGGFANFRETATKTKSLIDRLEALTLPKLDDVEGGLKKYLDVKEQAEELDRKIAEIDDLIDEVVYDLYGLDEDEIEVVEEAVSTE